MVGGGVAAGVRVSVVLCGGGADEVTSMEPITSDSVITIVRAISIGTRVVSTKGGYRVKSLTDAVCYRCVRGIGGAGGIPRCVRFVSLASLVSPRPAVRVAGLGFRFVVNGKGVLRRCVVAGGGRRANSSVGAGGVVLLCVRVCVRRRVRFGTVVRSVRRRVPRGGGRSVGCCVRTGGRSIRGGG